MSVRDDNIQTQLEIGQAAIRLQQNPDWKLVIDELYVEALIKTQVAICGNYTGEQLAGMAKEIQSRGKLVGFMQELVDMGNEAQEYINETNAGDAKKV